MDDKELNFSDFPLEIQEIIQFFVNKISTSYHYTLRDLKTERAFKATKQQYSLWIEQNKRFLTKEFELKLKIFFNFSNEIF